MARTKDKPCPICGETFSSQGLVGHLQLKHKLEGEELQEEYRKVVPPGGEAPNMSLDEMGEESAESASDEDALGSPLGNRDDPVQRALWQVANARARLEAAKGEIDPSNQLGLGSGAVSNALFGKSEMQKVRDEAVSKAEADVEEARKNLQEALKQKMEAM